MDEAYFALAFVGLIASLLTFFSGFGLGTMLLPAFAFFFPLDLSVALTAIVHLANNLFKFALMQKEVHWKTGLLFGAPAILTAILGALVLSQLGHLDFTVYRYTLDIFSEPTEIQVKLLGLIMGSLLIFFAVFELISPVAEGKSSHLILGGALSGFFGGLSGHQGALRSVFLLRQGLSRDSFVATGIAIACAVDVGRLMVYGAQMEEHLLAFDPYLLLTAILSAFAGALLGKRLLKKVTIRSIQLLVCGLLIAVGISMVLGVIG